MSSENWGKLPRGSFPFLFIFAFFGIFPLMAREEKPTSNILIQEALIFFIKDENAEATQALIEKSLKAPDLDLSLFKIILQYQVQKKDRASLLKVFRAAYEFQRCGSSPLPLCQDLRLLWDHNLDSVVFLEGTAGKIEQARRLIVAKNCKEALVVLKEIEMKEGDFKPLLELFAQSYLCLNDAAGKAKIETRLEELNLGANADES